MTQFSDNDTAEVMFTNGDAALQRTMARCNAFQEDLHNYRLIFPEAASG